MVYGMAVPDSVKIPFIKQAIQSFMETGKYNHPLKGQQTLKGWNTEWKERIGKFVNPASGDYQAELVDSFTQAYLKDENFMDEFMGTVNNNPEALEKAIQGEQKGALLASIRSGNLEGVRQAVHPPLKAVPKAKAPEKTAPKASPPAPPAPPATPADTSAAVAAGEPAAEKPEAAPPEKTPQAPETPAATAVVTGEPKPPAEKPAEAEPPSAPASESPVAAAAAPSEPQEPEKAADVGGRPEPDPGVHTGEPPVSKAASKEPGPDKTPVAGVTPPPNPEPLQAEPAGIDKVGGLEPIEPENRVGFLGLLYKADGTPRLGAKELQDTLNTNPELSTALLAKMNAEVPAGQVSPIQAWTTYMDAQEAKGNDQTLLKVNKLLVDHPQAVGNLSDKINDAIPTEFSGFLGKFMPKQNDDLIMDPERFMKFVDRTNSFSQNPLMGMIQSFTSDLDLGGGLGSLLENLPAVLSFIMDAFTSFTKSGGFAGASNTGNKLTGQLAKATGADPKAKTVNGEPVNDPDEPDQTAENKVTVPVDPHAGSTNTPEHPVPEAS